MKGVKKKRLLNIIMAVMIAAIVFSGVMFAGSLRGWFLDEDTICVLDKLGNANIEREGIAFSLTEGTALADDDSIETLGGSTVTLAIKSLGSIVLGEDTRVIINAREGNTICLEMLRGEVFVNIDARDSTRLALNINGRVITAKAAVFSLGAPSGSQSVYVYGGSVNFAADNISDETAAQAGQAATLFAGDSGETIGALSTLRAVSLNDFLIEQIMSANDTILLCFTDEDLNTVVADRKKEMMAIKAEREEYEQELIAQGGNVIIKIDDEEVNPNEEADLSNDAQTSSGTTSSSNTTTSSSPAADSSPETSNNPSISSSAVPTATPEPTAAQDIFTCTIAIRCDTILQNMENLVEGKGQYVPANGTILATSSVQFYNGETVLEVLKRACKAAGIQIEYSYFPIYESYYIEGINHLYEFDCGAESGWMYKVNGWFPNYGCSAYELEDSDTIVWCYTCNGLGADVGGSVY